MFAGARCVPAPTPISLHFFAAPNAAEGVRYRVQPSGKVVPLETT